MSDLLGFFNVDDRLGRLSDLGDQLEDYAATVDFEIFCPTLEAASNSSDGAKGSRQDALARHACFDNGGRCQA